MKFREMATMGMLALGMGGVSAAAPPVLDRPSPPPCCADGRGYASPQTFGWYATRWRRWPMDCADLTQTRQLGPTPPRDLELPKYQPPRPADEDRRAPPPTTPPAEPATGAGTTSPSTTGTENRSGSAPTGNFPLPVPPPATLFQPNSPTDSETPRRGTLPPYVPEGPTPRTLDSGPTSDVDPPPSLPFGGGAISAQPPTRAVHQPAALPAPRIEQRSRGAADDSTDDPPPSLPTVLAGLSNY